jgi:site-specific DNA recombinase
VLTYKLDRLSRSLLDFARLMELFDQHQVAFVSVTQQFHSATSMGRLVLNMLLSFAQFERELIAVSVSANQRATVSVRREPGREEVLRSARLL